MGSGIQKRVGRCEVVDALDSFLGAWNDDSHVALAWRAWLGLECVSSSTVAPNGVSVRYRTVGNLRETFPTPHRFMKRAINAITTT